MTNRTSSPSPRPFSSPPPPPPPPAVDGSNYEPPTRDDKNDHNTTTHTTKNEDPIMSIDIFDYTEEKTTTTAATATERSDGNVNINIVSTATDGKELGMPPMFVMKAVVIASLGGILFGYDMGVVSAALPQLAKAFELSDSQKEMVVSFLYLGGGAGAALGGTVCDVFGRKNAILLTDVIFLLGALILFYSPDLTAVLLGRTVVGFAVALSGIADVAYLHEISPSEWRGSIVSVNEACISLGFLISYVMGYGVSSVDPEGGWRWMFGLGSVIAVVQFLGMVWFMPESPVWLRENGHVLEAALVEEQCGMNRGGNVSGSKVTTIASNVKQVVSSKDVCHHSSSNALITLVDTEHNATNNDNYESDMVQEQDKGELTMRNNMTQRKYSSVDMLNTSLVPNYHGDQSSLSSPSISSEHFEILNDGGGGEGHNVKNDDGISQRIQKVHRSTRSKYEQWNDLYLQLSRYRRQIILGIFLSLAQQFCGHTNILNFAPTIFMNVGFDSDSTPLIVTVLLGIVKVLITCWVIWKIEAIGRRTLLLYGMALISVSLILLSLAYENSRNVEGNMSLGSKCLALTGVFGVVAGYAASFGPLTWLLVSELFPSSIRGRCLGASYIFTYLGAALVSNTFLTWQGRYGPAAPFIFYSVVTISSMIFVHVAMPDTSGKDTTQIEKDIDNMPFWREGQNSQEYSSMAPMPIEPEFVLKIV